MPVSNFAPVLHHFFLGNECELVIYKVYYSSDGYIEMLWGTSEDIADTAGMMVTVLLKGYDVCVVKEEKSNES